MTHVCNEPHCINLAEWSYRHQGADHYVCSNHKGLHEMRLGALGHGNALDDKYVAFTRLWLDPGPTARLEEALNNALGEIEALKPYRGIATELQTQLTQQIGEVNALNRRIEQVQRDHARLLEEYKTLKEQASTEGS